jgi:hypothetical protein
MTEAGMKVDLVGKIKKYATSALEGFTARVEAAVNSFQALKDTAKLSHR